MRTIYIDSENKCHTENDGTMKAVETDFFDGKCDFYIEGHCYEDNGNHTSVYAYKPYDELAAAQAQYELDMAEAAAAYQEGVDSAYDQ